MGASRVYDDVKLAAKAGADVIVVDGMEGGTGASPAILQEHTGIPTLAAVCEARAALEDMGLVRRGAVDHRRAEFAMAWMPPRRWLWARTPAISALLR